MNKGASFEITSDKEVSNMRLEIFDIVGPEMKWCLFISGKRASIGKLILQIANNITSPALNSCSMDASPSQSPHIPISKTAHIKSIFIHKEYRGRELSKFLIGKCKMLLSEYGVDKVILEAEEDVTRYGKLIALYEECGFHIVGDESNIKYEYNGDDCYRRVPMECKIDHGKVLTFTKPAWISAITKACCSHIILYIVDMESEQFCKVLREKMTQDFVMKMRKETIEMKKTQMTIVEALHALNTKDPGSFDRSIAVAMHIREQGQPDWMQFAGLVSELGRIQQWLPWNAPFTGVQKDDILLDHQEYPLPGWARADFTDTWVVGQYQHHIGMRNVNLSWSKDEYLSIILSENKSLGLPIEAIDVIRFHRLASWIDDGCYKELMDESVDEQVLKWTRLYRDLVREAASSAYKHTSTIEDGVLFAHSLVEKYYPNIVMW